MKKTYDYQKELAAYDRYYQSGVGDINKDRYVQEHPRVNGEELGEELGEEHDEG